MGYKFSHAKTDLCDVAEKADNILKNLHDKAGNRLYIADRKSGLIFLFDLETHHFSLCSYWQI